MELFTGLFPLGAWAVALLFAGAAVQGGPRPVPRSHVVERLIQGILYFPVGIQALFAFIGHVFLSVDPAAPGWDPAPWRYELGVAHLGLAVAGIIGVRAGPGFRFATALVALCLLGGTAMGIVARMVHGSVEADAVAWLAVATDLLTPLALLFLLRVQQRIGEWPPGEQPVAP